jgi:hypothetical protein
MRLLGGAPCQDLLHELQADWLTHATVNAARRAGAAYNLVRAGWEGSASDAAAGVTRRSDRRSARTVGNSAL